MSLRSGRKKKHTKAEDEYLSECASLGCLPCIKDGHPDTPASVHHPRHGEDGQNVGMGGRAPHKDGIPMCEGHHQGNVDTTKIAIHRDPIGFEARYGTERELVEETKRLLILKRRQESILPPRFLPRAG